MISERLLEEVRPARVLAVAEAEASVEAFAGEPLLVHGQGAVDAVCFARIASRLGYGTSVVFFNSGEEVLRVVGEIGSDFQEWSPPGLPAGARAWVRQKTDARGYGSHVGVLLEAVRRAGGPVLELGAGEISTPALHDACAGHFLVTVERDPAWIARFEHLACPVHLFDRVNDPAETPRLDPGTSWGVVFIDHSPGETRPRAVARARAVADLVVVHDTEELGYGLEPVLRSFRHRRDHRERRPWTTVASDRRETL